MTQLTIDQLVLLQKLQGHGGWIIANSANYFGYKHLEDVGYVEIRAINPTKFHCQITETGRAALANFNNW